MKPIQYLALLMIVTSLFSCKKDKELSGKSKLKLLTQKPWTIYRSQLEYETQPGKWRDIVLIPTDRDYDNEIIFNENNLFGIFEGATDQRPSVDDSEVLWSDEWYFLESETKIQMGDDVIGVIIELSETQLILEQHFSPARTDGAIRERAYFRHP